ncbi:hypothetical protein E4U42_005287 [Claviceps africana]|uniref:Fanconi-associated nuclease n=1 Tax=Claviceps africana TaxID=83212 RepID=A0A8K0NJU5_9HYPO|nr:hypothetical protein E4U42_005287 [Claviceps africana]
MDGFVRKSSKQDATGKSNGIASRHDNGTRERPTKRRKHDEIRDSESETGELLSLSVGDVPAPNEVSRKVQISDDGEEKASHGVTAVENVLPPTQINDESIEKYEHMKASSVETESNEATEETKSSWIKGKSSIYVDAFNLALDTVLEEESALFDEKEMEVFRQWKELDYGTQYLYVRLFLRKTAAWHRCSRLGYYADVSEPDVAMKTLQTVRILPSTGDKGIDKSLTGLGLERDSLDGTFTFADSSENHIDSVEEAAPLLLLDELKALAKEAKIQGKNKTELITGLCRMSEQQVGLMALGLSRQNSRNGRASASEQDSVWTGDKAQLKRQNSNRREHFLGKILAILGPCIRLSPLTLKLFERVHLVFYRSTGWTDKSLTTIILAKIARRNFADYVVCRTCTIFASRLHLLEFEAGIRLEAEVDTILESVGIPSEEGLERIMDIFTMVYPRWKHYVEEEREKERVLYEMGEGAYLRRFNPAHSYTRLIVKALWVLGRRKEHAREHALLEELLGQRLFHLSRRGSWYQRKALLEEHYMANTEDGRVSGDPDQRKKAWKKIAASTCESGLQDPNCHLIHHYDLQKRLLKLEKKLRIPKRLQHDFGHARLAEPLEIQVEGIQLKRISAPRPGAQAASTKTIWLDELDSGGECRVEEMCLSYFRSEGWKGYHAEGGAIRTIFAYLFYDILFLYIPNVFQTAYQTCPLDLHTDAFFPARASEINHRLVEIANGEGEGLLRRVWEREHVRRPSVVGLNWDFDVQDMAELVGCFQGSALAAVCKVMAQEYKHRGGGVPDLILWRRAEDGSSESNAAREAAGRPRGEVMFAEVKSANDRLSDTQRLWIHVLAGAGVKVALVNAVAREVREVD